MAKIEVWTKDVGEHKLELLNDPQHLYLVFTHDSGKKEIIRGGPEKEHLINNGILLVVHQSYNDSKQDDHKIKTYDWNDGTHIGKVIVSGNEVELSQKWLKIWHKGQEINVQRYDYKYLIQNSNTAVIQVTKEVGLNDEVETFVVSNRLWTPAYQFELEHSPMDRLADVLTEGINATYGSVEQFKERLAQLNLSPYVWLYRIVKKLGLSFKAILKTRVKQLMERLLSKEMIDPLKPIIVVEEDATGRNQLFVDQLTGEVMDRETFVALIESEKYTGYLVANIDEIETPKSRADDVLVNNLG